MSFRLSIPTVTLRDANGQEHQLAVGDRLIIRDDRGLTFPVEVVEIGEPEPDSVAKNWWADPEPLSPEPAA